MNGETYVGENARAGEEEHDNATRPEVKMHCHLIKLELNKNTTVLGGLGGEEQLTTTFTKLP